MPKAVGRGSYLLGDERLLRPFKNNKRLEELRQKINRAGRVAPEVEKEFEKLWSGYVVQ